MKQKGKHTKITQEADQAYFDSLTDTIMNRIETEKSILFSNPKLKALPFKTPEGYFERLGVQIDQRTTKETRVIPLFTQQWIRYAAAVILLLIASLAFFNPFSEQRASQNYLSDISEDVIIEYVAAEDELIDELLMDDEVMELVLDDMLADIAYNYEDLIDFEKDSFYPENY